MNTSNNNVVEKVLKNAYSPPFKTEGDSSSQYIKEVKTPLGDVYIINEKTNEKFIKGTQRSDGTFRKNIPIKFDYMPRDERCLYQVRGKILNEQRNQTLQSCLTVENSEDLKQKNDTARKVPGWNPIEEKSENNLKKKKRKKKKKKNSQNPEDNAQN